MRVKMWFLFLLVFLMAGKTTLAREKSLTIVHSNDLHSHLLGFSPNIDYTPQQTGDDETLGGWARIATVIKEVKGSRENPVLVLDAGDFLMGSFFHLLIREEAFELRLMKMMGYDVTTLGNHEFDLRPGGLTRILEAAHRRGQIPSIVLSNALFSDESPEDDSLEEIFGQGIVKPYVVLEREGIRIGIFGLMGKDAAEVAPFAAPVRFDDPIRVAKRVVRELRQKEKVDMVICLSHGGLWEDKDRSEDEILAREVKGIDIIISGHTHTKTDSALKVDNTIIVQAWEHGKQVGVLDLGQGEGTVFVKNYQIIEIDDNIPGDRQILNEIEAFETLIDQKTLADMGLGFREIIAQSGFDLTIETEESNLGNLIADSIQWIVNKHDYDPKDPASRVAVAVISNGVIRDPVVRGKTGKIALCDVFRAIPLGIGMDDTMGYPLISFYIYPSELKKGFEILTSIYPMKGSDYFLQVSGARFTYNPNRMIFDRITDIWIGSEEDGYVPLDYSDSNKTLLRVAADIYNATFLKIVGDFTWHVLDIVPKDRNGNPIIDLKAARIDVDREKQGIQELKEWTGVIQYIQNFTDETGDGIADIPGKYSGRLGRNVVEASWNPYKLLRRGTYITWIAFVIFLIVLALILIILRFLLKRIRS
jgi:5'-nucleotidase